MTQHLLRAFLGGAALTLVAGAAQAGGSSGAGCGCVPTSHTVTVPGINVTPPSITVNTPTINITAPVVDVQSTAVAYSQASAGASADASSSASAFTYANALAAANAVTSFGGGGGGYVSGGGGTSYIPNLVVEGVEGPAAARQCTEMRSIARMTAIQAVCLDDKAVPHPASQVEADRSVAPGYEGEVFRCIAGTHMQYTLGAFAGAADFSHGQTISCLKGDALYHAATGALACRPQRPARDCNERSLLRRYGAGIKVLSLAARQCVAWSGGQVAASAAPGSLALDGGVGGP